MIMPKKKKPAKKSVKVVKVRKPAAKPASKPKAKAPAKSAAASPVAVFRDAILHHL